MKADFDFVEFSNIIEWMLEHNKGKELCKLFDNATSVVQKLLNVTKVWNY